MEKEKALANLLLLEIKMTKQVNSARGQSKATIREYAKALDKVCKLMDIDPEVVDSLVNPV